jgi:hypothetical protein
MPQTLWKTAGHIHLLADYEVQCIVFMNSALKYSDLLNVRSNMFGYVHILYDMWRMSYLCLIISKGIMFEF